MNVFRFYDNPQQDLPSLATWEDRVQFTSGDSFNVVIENKQMAEVLKNFL